jgi:hypothetical protein
MIISKIIGGLGNQLFQYAAGKSLALHHNTSLLLDVSSFNEYKLRNFDLAAFHVDIKFADGQLLQPFTTRSVFGKLRDRLLPIPWRKVLKPQHFHFDRRFFSASSTIYLQGYWQSEKYFAPIANTIRKEFRLKEEYTQAVEALAAQMRSRQSVAVHMRMGDYMDPHVKEVHGVLSPSYYKKAILRLQEKYPDASFYFFSDNMELVKQHVDIKEASFVSGILAKTHFEDFYLMTQCRHNIIANSSFSWWAAWLNNNAGKTVIAPQQWFGPKGPRDTQDLFPEGWICL